MCIAVVSLVLAGAYVTTNHNTIGVRDSQEHAEALKLVESQLEQVRADAGVAADVFTAAAPFCMVNQAPVSAVTSPDAAKCIQDSSGNATTSQPAYHLSITRSSSNGGSLFTITAQWADVNGSGQAQESMVYRLYK